MKKITITLLTGLMLSLLIGCGSTSGSIRAGYVSYIINTRAILSGVHYADGAAIRKCAIMNGVTMFTSLDTVRRLLDILEDIAPRISTI